MAWRTDSLKKAWRERKFITALVIFLNGSTEICWPGGENDYNDNGFAKFGYWSFKPGDPMCLRTWWREVFHFLGGMMYTLPVIWWPLGSMMVTFFISVVIFFSEVIDDGKWKPDLKNLIDWLFWVAGSASVTAASLTLFASEKYK